MSVSEIPLRTRIELWARSAGRCQYPGCNLRLWMDGVTKRSLNTAYIAHIIADKPGGPRGDPALSVRLQFSYSNLLLLCDAHHRLIDTDVTGHPVERLRAMKEVHERRIEIVAEIHNDRQSHVLLYGANIGEQSASVSFQNAAAAMIPNWYPAEIVPFTLGMKNSSYMDQTKEYWRIESDHLRKMVTQVVRPRLVIGDVQHLSVFAAAPQPLLILLGSLLTDLHPAEVYQLHKEEPRSWEWHEEPSNIEYIVLQPTETKGPPALIISLSGTITEDRITSVLGPSVTIWHLTIPEPHNDFLKSRAQAQLFRQRMRMIMDRIKQQHGEKALLHVFPAMPVALAVELGRVLMPKADLPLRIYDENKALGGFVHALDIGTIKAIPGEIST